jgi:pyruvate kinase
MTLNAIQRSSLKRPAAGRTREADRKVSAKRLLSRIVRIRAAVIRESQAIVEDWTPNVARPSFLPGAINLAQYLAFRRHDLSGLQHQLSALGLTSLGRSEGRVMATLDAVCARLTEIAGEPAVSHPVPLAFRNGKRILRREQARIFGSDPHGPGTRIMVTLPTRASEDRALVADIIRAGADCLRINCAHGGPETWATMIGNSRAAAAEQGRTCPILMDIAGPKCRIAEVCAPKKTRLHRGDLLMLAGRMPAQLKASDIVIRVTFPAVLDQLEVGARVFIDDGRIGARVERIEPDGAMLRVEQARSKGEKLRRKKGLNFPDTALDLPPLTEKDIHDLDFVAENADLVGFSFVQRPSDITLIQRELAARRGGRPVQPLVIKIETALAVRNLPELIVHGAGQQPLAVMIARGDLAVESGFENIGEVQEHILWLCEAAHVPVIWATQVLAGMVEQGAPSRAEITDAAMGQRAECVMLNKGPFIVEAVRLLDDVLRRMDRHQLKKSARLMPLELWIEPQDARQAREAERR